MMLSEVADVLFIKYIFVWRGDPTDGTVISF